MSHPRPARSLRDILEVGRSRPFGGLSFSPGTLRETVSKIVDRDELTVQRLAAELPVSTGRAADVLEKQIGKGWESFPLPAAIARVLLAARAVVHLTTPSGPATGFMIGPGLVMTNNHVLVGVENKRDATPADGALTLTFNYEQGLDGGLANIEQFKSDPTRFFAADRELDFAVIGVKGDPGEKFGALALPGEDVTIEKGDDVFIVQHPNGGPKQIAWAQNVVQYVDDRVVQYTTDTLPGSSGAPVFDQQWRLVAIHHGGGDIPEPSTGEEHFRNEGTLIRAILGVLELP